MAYPFLRKQSALVIRQEEELHNILLSEKSRQQRYRINMWTCVNAPRGETGIRHTSCRGGERWGKATALLFYITSISFNSFTKRIELYHLNNKEHLKACITYHHSNYVTEGRDKRKRKQCIVGSHLRASGPWPWESDPWMARKGGRGTNCLEKAQMKGDPSSWSPRISPWSWVDLLQCHWSVSLLSIWPIKDTPNSSFSQDSLKCLPIIYDIGLHTPCYM